MAVIPDNINKTGKIERKYQGRFLRAEPLR
jgi:hypothetical protein